MADRLKMLRAVARQVAAERAVGPVRRPPSARIPLPRDHELDLALGTVHAVRITAPGIDLSRFEAALRVAASCHDALRLGVVRDSGRSFLAELDSPVARSSDLDRADPSHPLRWSVDGDTITVAVSAYLMDRSCWGTVLSTVQAAYASEPWVRPELEYGDYCYWLAHLDEPLPIDVGHPSPEPYWELGADQPWGAASRAVRFEAGERSVAFDNLCRSLADAFYRCGWQTAGIRMQQWKPRPPSTPIVGRVDQPVIGIVRRGRAAFPSAPTGAVADAVDPWWASFTEPLVQVHVDILDLPSLTFDGRPASVEPVLREAPGWQCLLIRTPNSTHLHLSGPTPTLHPLLTTYPSNPPPPHANGHLHRAADHGGPLSPQGSEGRVHRGEDDGPLSPQGSKGRLWRAPGLVTPLRTLSAEVVEAASKRRADELKEAGVEPGLPLVIEATDGPETIANLIAAFKCRADVLLLDMDDSPEWRAGLLDRLPGAARVSTDNLIHLSAALPPPTDTDVPSANVCQPHSGTTRRRDGRLVTGDGEGALLVGLSSAPGVPVLARIPLYALVEGAAALGEMTKGRACAVDAARGGEDLVLKVLACGMCGADVVLVGKDGREAVELLSQVPDAAMERHLATDWSVPLHHLTDLTWLRRGTDVAENALTRWWVAEAPAAQWLAALRPYTSASSSPGGEDERDAEGQGQRDAERQGERGGVGQRGMWLRSGVARITDEGGRSMPEGTIGRVAVGVPTGSRYVGDPRRTAEYFRPAANGARELWTDTVAAILDSNAGGMKVVRFAPDRTVDRNRTCLTDALRVAVPSGFVGVQPSTDKAFVVAPEPVDTRDLPQPLSGTQIRVDPKAAQMDFVEAWRSVQARAAERDDGEPEDWVSEDEAALAKEVVEPVLGMPVRRNDDLFSLGATSLQLMRVLLQVKERFGVEVPLARFFAGPSVRVLSELIEQTSDPAAAALEVLQGIEGEDP